MITNTTTAFSPCEFKTTCESCTSLTFCMFIFLVTDFGSKHWKCVNKADKEKHSNKTVHVYMEQRECGKIQLESKEKPSYQYEFQEYVQFNLLNNYSAKSSPSSVTGQPTFVNLRLDISKVALDPPIQHKAEQTVKVNATLFMKWNDTRLSWWKDLKVFLNHTRIPIPAMNYTEKFIWKPEVTPSNGRSNITRVDIPPDPKIYVEQMGTAYLNYPVVIETICELNTRSWPLYSYNCGFGVDFYSEDVLLNEEQERQQSSIQRQSDLILLPLPNTSNENAVDYLSVGDPNLRHYRATLEFNSTNCLVANCGRHYIQFSFIMGGTSLAHGIVSTFLFLTGLACIYTTMVLWLRPTQIIKIVLAFFDLPFLIYLYVHYHPLLPAVQPNFPIIFVLYYINFALVFLSVVFSMIVLCLKGGDLHHFPPILLPIISNEKWLRIFYLVPVKRHLTVVTAVRFENHENDQPVTLPLMECQNENEKDGQVAGHDHGLDQTKSRQDLSQGQGQDEDQCQGQSQLVRLDLNGSQVKDVNNGECEDHFHNESQSDQNESQKEDNHDQNIRDGKGTEILYEFDPVYQWLRLISIVQRTICFLNVIGIAVTVVIFIQD